MADTIIKAPTGSGNKLVLQTGSGDAGIEVSDGADVLLHKKLTSGTLGANVSVANCIIKKWHHFTFTTRTDVSSLTSANDIQFTWTTAFTPIDPVNNGLWVVGAVPATGYGQDVCGYGLRFSKSGGSDYDFYNKGTWATDVPSSSGGEQTFQSYSFNIAAGTIPAGTYTITHRISTASSNMKIINPSTTDQARFNPQLTSELMIREYKNP